MLKQEFGVDSQLERGSGGIFDVWVDGQKVFSKHDEGGFPEEAEVVRRIKARR